MRTNKEAHLLNKNGERKDSGRMVRREMFPSKSTNQEDSNKKAIGKAPKIVKKGNSSKEVKRENSLKAIAKERKPNLRRVAKIESTPMNVNSKSEEILLIWRSNSAQLIMTGLPRIEAMTEMKENPMKKKVASMKKVIFLKRKDISFKKVSKVTK